MTIFIALVMILWRVRLFVSCTENADSGSLAILIIDSSALDVSLDCFARIPETEVKDQTRAKRG